MRRGRRIARVRCDRAVARLGFGTRFECVEREPIGAVHRLVEVELEAGLVALDGESF